MGRLLRTKAIVLRRTNFGEADRILTLLTPDDGVVSAIARGVRREKSKFAGSIELFARIELTISDGKGKLGVVTGARLEEFYGAILEDIERTTVGYGAILQVHKAASDIAHEAGYFELLDRTLAALGDPTISLELTRAWFWLQLGIVMGEGLNLLTDTNGMKLVEGARYDYDGEHSALQFHENGRFHTAHIKLLRLLSVSTPQLVRSVRGHEELIGDCAWLAEQTVAH